MRYLLRGLLLSVLLIGASACSAADAGKFEEGKQYKAVRIEAKPGREGPSAKEKRAARAEARGETGEAAEEEAEG